MDDVVMSRNNNIDRGDFNQIRVEKKRRRFPFWILILLILAVLFGAFMKRDAVMKKLGFGKTAQEESAGPTSLVDQYKNQLPDLKKKAEKGNSGDLQNYAVAQYATGDVAGAEETYKKQIQSDPNNAVIHNNLANALRDQGNFEEAIKEYKESIKINPKSITSYINLGNMYQYSLQKQDEAIKVYQEAANQNPDNADVYVLIGIAYENSGDKGNATKGFQKALEIKPDNQAAKAGLDRVSK